MATQARRHRRASPPPGVLRGPARAAGKSGDFRFRDFSWNHAFSFVLDDLTPESETRTLFILSFRESRNRRLESSAAPEATLTARRRRRTPETHRTMFAVHSFATHSSAAAFRPALRRYAPRRPPPIARATWPARSTLASVDDPARRRMRVSRRPPRTRLESSPPRTRLAPTLTRPPVRLSSRRAGRPPSAAAAPCRSARAPSPRTTSRLA